jgi:hypothetical protein
VGGCGLDSSGSGWRSVSGSCKRRFVQALMCVKCARSSGCQEVQKVTHRHNEKAISINAGVLPRIHDSSVL